MTKSGKSSLLVHELESYSTKFSREFDPIVDVLHSNRLSVAINFLENLVEKVFSCQPRVNLWQPQNRLQAR